MFVVKKRTRTSACAISAGKKTADPVHSAHKESYQEQAENAAVEDRAENVAGFDQVLDQTRE